MGIERFAARRGVPSVLWSDNRTNFIASEKELLQNVSAWNQQILSEALVKKRIHWKFIPVLLTTEVSGNELSGASNTFFMQSLESLGNRGFHNAITPKSRRRPQETLRTRASVLRCNLGPLAKRLRSVA